MRYAAAMSSAPSLVPPLTVPADHFWKNTHVLDVKWSGWNAPGMPGEQSARVVVSCYSITVNPDSEGEYTFHSMLDLKNRWTHVVVYSLAGGIAPQVRTYGGPLEHAMILVFPKNCGDLVPKVLEAIREYRKDLFAY